MNQTNSPIKPLTTDAIASTSKADNNKKPVYEHTQTSIWSNIKYLFGMLAALVIPPLIPGVTSRELIMGYVAFVLAIYFGAFVYKLVLAYRPAKRRKERAH